MTRALAAGVLLALSACGGGGAAPTDPGSSARPDILVVYSDDQRFDSLSATGNPYIRTPHLDRVANEGVVFERAYVTTSRCCPGRASFLTGEYATSHGVWENHPDHDFLADHTTIADDLSASGYDTAWIGKWHLPNPGANPVRGFRHWVSYEGPGSHFDQVFNVDGVTTPSAGFQADRLTDYALAFLDRERGDAPYFLVVAFKNPHVPLTPAPRHAGVLADVPLQHPVSADDPEESLPAFVRALQQGTRHAIDWATWEHDVRAYWELVLSIDDNVGRLLDHLDEGGRLDRTLVLCTTDNGQLLGEHGIEQKGCAYEPSIRVPLVARWPGHLPSGERRRELALNVDLRPTLLDAAGVATSARMHGRSLLDVFDAAAAPWRTGFLYLLPSFGEGGLSERAWVEDRWKLVVDQVGRFEEVWLIDLQTDPDERTNRAQDPALAGEVARLRAALEDEDRRLR